jgi:type IV secretory pathway TrbF-like protein
MEGSVYLKARQEWDERYADLVLGKRNWQITAAGMMAITLVLALASLRSQRSFLGHGAHELRHV